MKPNLGPAFVTQHALLGCRRASVLLLCLTFAAMGCGQPSTPKPVQLAVEPAQQRKQSSRPLPSVRITDVTSAAGLHFEHNNGAFGKKLLPETMGSGVAFVDFDKDGSPDLLFVNGCAWPGFESSPEAKTQPTLALYRNNGKGKFTNMTQASGLDAHFHGMGVTVGDYDNDGWPDFFVTGVGGNHLFHNEPAQKGRRFRDVTATAGELADAAAGPLPTGTAFLSLDRPLPWGSSAAFLDYDNDGKLDLFVCNYVTWAPKHDLDQDFTLTGSSERTYGPPHNFEGAYCNLYHNVGNGSFKNVTSSAGIAVRGELGKAIGKSLGVSVCDVDEDGYVDIVVANDTVRNFFFHNQRDGTFKELGQETGIAYADGTARGGMGIDWAEYRTGKKGLVIGNFANEPNTLFRLDQPKKMLFSDVALIEGVAGPSRIALAFGTFFFDFDLDGALDLFTCNGHLEPRIQVLQAGQSFKQPAQLFWNTGQKPAFEPMSPEQCGPDLFQPIVGRGCAYADMDGNGTLDVVVTQNGGPARLFKNNGMTGHHWIRLVLEGNGKRCNTSAIGARVRLTSGGITRERQVTSSRGYLSQSEMALTFGLGKTETVERVEIYWPGQDRPQVLPQLVPDRVHTIRQQ